MSTTAATPQPAAVPAAPVAAETVTGAALIGELPPVNERAVAAVAGPAVAAPAGAAAPAAASSVPVEKRPFDPKRFRTNPDGSPFLNHAGRYMPRGGRKPTKRAQPSTPAETGSSVPADIKPSTAGAAPSPSPTPQTAPVTPEQPAAPVSREELEASAEGILRGSYSLADSLMKGKGEWQPEHEAEHVGLLNAYVAWASASGKRPVSPGWGFLLAILGFVQKRLEMPNTLKRLVGWFPWLAGDEEPAPEQKPAAPVSVAAQAQPQRVSNSIA